MIYCCLQAECLLQLNALIPLSEREITKEGWPRKFSEGLKPLGWAHACESQVHDTFYPSKVIPKILKNLFSYYWHHLLFLFNVGINSPLQKSEVKTNLNSSQWQRFAIICIVAVFASRSSCLLLFPPKGKAGASPGSEDLIVERWKQTTGTPSGSSELALGTTSAVELLQEPSLHHAGLGSQHTHPWWRSPRLGSESVLRDCLKDGGGGGK